MSADAECEHDWHEHRFGPFYGTFIKSDEPPIERWVRCSRCGETKEVDLSRWIEEHRQEAERG